MDVSEYLAGLLLVCSTLVAGQAAAATGQDRTLLWQSDTTSLRWSAQFGLNLVAERNLFWKLSDAVVPQEGFEPDTGWLEGYVKPGLSFEHGGRGATAYGRISAVGSFTQGTDAFNATNAAAANLEEAYLGVRAPGQTPALDVSIGPRELKLGSGMLIANGGSSGFERGALKFGPRKAWRQALVARMHVNRAQATVFRIAPNELPSSEGNNRVAGADIRWDPEPGGYVGISYIRVLESGSPYVRAAAGGLGPPVIIPGGREGTKAVNLYFAVAPTFGPLKDWFISGDYARERNERIDLRAWGGRAQLGYLFSALRWNPRITLTHKSFSGDDPTTPALERFDPLYWDGSPST